MHPILQYIITHMNMAAVAAIPGPDLSCQIPKSDKAFSPPSHINDAGAATEEDVKWYMLAACMLAALLVVALLWCLVLWRFYMIGLAFDNNRIDCEKA